MLLVFTRPWSSPLVYLRYQISKLMVDIPLSLVVSSTLMLDTLFWLVPTYSNLWSFGSISRLNPIQTMITTELWLERMLLKFQYIIEEKDMCKGEPMEFAETLRHECEIKTLFKASAYVVAIWNATQIGLNLCNFGRKLYSLHQV
jgi:hypothetical protein